MSGLRFNPGSGGYEFETPAGTILMAWRNEAGFFGRQWELHRWLADRFTWVIEAEGFATRRETIEFGQRDF